MFLTTSQVKRFAAPSVEEKSKSQQATIPRLAGLCRRQQQSPRQKPRFRLRPLVLVAVSLSEIGWSVTSAVKSFAQRFVWTVMPRNIYKAAYAVPTVRPQLTLLREKLHRLAGHFFGLPFSAVF
jgi:hypothetical protein